MHESKLLRGTVGCKREETEGNWRILNSEELHNPYSVPNITKVIKSRTIRQEGNIARMVKMDNAHAVLVRKTEEKDLLRRCRRRTEIKKQVARM
jgi:hypothetical protein